MSKSPAKKIERLELIVVGGAFLMKKLYSRYRSDLGVGMDEQIRQFLRDAKQVEDAYFARQAKAEKEST